MDIVQNFGDLTFFFNFRLISDDCMQSNEFESLGGWSIKKDKGYYLSGNFDTFDDCYSARTNIANCNLQVVIGAPFSSKHGIGQFGLGRTEVIKKHVICQQVDKLDIFTIETSFHFNDKFHKMHVQFIKRMDGGIIIDKIYANLPANDCAEWYKKFAKFVHQINVGPNL